MDEYKKLFFKYRPMEIAHLGNLTPRADLRKRLQCKPFRWFLENVQRNIYVPDFESTVGMPSSQAGAVELCVDGDAVKT